MVRNYLKIAFRILRRQRVHSVINISSLSIGLACCLLIVLYVRHELSYDRFHENADRIYRVVQEQRFATVQQVAVTGGPVGPGLVQEYPEVEAAVRFIDDSGVMSYGEKQFIEESLMFVDSNLFQIFSFPFIQGDPATALSQPNTIVLTQAMTDRYFSDENAIGKVLHFRFHERNIDLLVTGVMQNLPSNSHLTFDAVISIATAEPYYPWMSQWGASAFWTYVLLRPGSSAQMLNVKLPALVKKYRGAEVVEHISYFLQPLTDIHLYSHLVADTATNSDVEIVYIFSAIALLVLLIASINYMNLATARSLRRICEVGMRKIVGASRVQLIWQFLGESCLLTLLALVGALLLVEASLPAFNVFLNKQLSMTSLYRLPGLAALMGFFLLVSLFSGSYPAFHFSSFLPAEVLKGMLPISSTGGRLRKILVVIQFIFAIALIAATSVAYQQLQYVQNKQLGFDKEHLVTVAIRDAYREVKPLKTAFKQLPQVVSVTASDRPLGKFFVQQTFRPEGAPTQEEILGSYLSVAPDFIDTMGMTMFAGRFFSPDMASDSTDAVVINETAARRFGWLSAEEAIGKRLLFGEQRLEVIGVLRDFNFASLHQVIEPLVMMWRPTQLFSVTLRIQPEDVSGTLTALEKIWHNTIVEQPFDYDFVDERLDRLYQNDRKVSQMFSIFATLAILIACLGLLGLAAYAAETRTKEIGIRKVLGASVANVTALLSKDFVKLVLIANIVAWPAAYLLMNSWLQNFAYRINISWWVFALAGGVALLIALLTVCTQAVRAALANPVESLRYE